MGFFNRKWKRKVWFTIVRNFISSWTFFIWFFTFHYSVKVELNKYNVYCIVYTYTQFIMPMLLCYRHFISFRLAIFYHLICFISSLKRRFIYIYAVFLSFHHFTTIRSDMVVVIIVAVDICSLFRIHFMRQSSPRELLSTKTHFTSVAIPFKL